MQEPGAAPGTAAPRGSRGGFAPHIWVADSQSFPNPRGRRSRIRPCVRTALCYRVIYGVRQRRSRDAESSRTPF